MSAQNEDLARVLEAIETLRASVERLGDRVARLEGERRPRSAAEAEAEAWRDASAASVAPAAARIDAETMMAIGAALAAYLGEKPRIRAIRLLGSEAWAQQGRATIQAWYSVSTNPSR